VLSAGWIHSIFLLAIRNLSVDEDGGGRLGLFTVD